MPRFPFNTSEVIPFDPKSGISHFTFGNETYAVLTAPFLQDNNIRPTLTKQLSDRTIPLRGVIVVEPDVERRDGQLVTIDGGAAIRIQPLTRCRVEPPYGDTAPSRK